MPKRAEAARPRVEPVQTPAIGPDPELVTGTLRHARHDVAAQTLRIARIVLVAGERLARDVEPGESATEGSDPEFPFGILEKGHDAVRTEAPRVGGVVSVGLEALGAGIEPTPSKIGTAHLSTPLTS